MYLMVKRIQANSRGRTPVKQQKSAEGAESMPKRTDL